MADDEVRWVPEDNQHINIFFFFEIFSNSRL